MEHHQDFDASNSPEFMDENQVGTDPLSKRPGSKAKGRKRTKTGCLTCRKRRIKCGEERPTCNNCTKSKRHCEGYKQRVVFKDPMDGCRPPMPPFSQCASSCSAYPQSKGRRESYPQSASAQTPLPIALKPSSSTGPLIKAEHAALSPSNERRINSANINLPGVAKEGTRVQQKAQLQLQETPIDTRGHSYVLERRPPNDRVTHYDFNALVKQESRGASSYASSRTTPSDSSAGPHCMFPTMQHSDISDGHCSTAGTFHQPHSLVKWEPEVHVSTARGSHEHRGSIGTFQPHHQKLPEQHTQRPDDSRRLSVYPGNWQGHQQAEVSPPAPRWTPVQAVLECRPELDDMVDPFDVSEEDDDIDMLDYNFDVMHDDPQDTHLKRNDLGIVVAVQAGQGKRGLNLRSFVSFIDRPDMLATYTPSSQSTPLRDPMTARIFCHFVNVTGPCMSMFERHPSTPELMFRGTPVPKSQQHIWAYTFPRLALNNSALLHAMLALASLHISKLQGGPITASYKHYALSLRRIAKSVSLPTRRGHPATLAAAMLLAFYECWAADHQKWSNHLLGAKQLVEEIDFAGMTRYINRRKAQKRQEVLERHLYVNGHGLEYDFR